MGPVGVYAIIWKASVPPDEFERRIPGVLEWLQSLRDQKRLRACGGWSSAEGGLTVIEGESMDEALQINALNPLSEIGTTEIYEWDVFYADLVFPWRL